jgi:hypothetical protein
LLPGCPVASDEPVDSEQNNRTYRSHNDRDDAIADTTSNAENLASQETAHNCARYPDQDRNYDAAGIVAWHDQLGERARDEADDDPSYYSDHWLTTSFEYVPGPFAVYSLIRVHETLVSESTIYFFG